VDWKGLSDAQKAPFERMALDNMERHEAEKKQLEAEMSDETVRIATAHIPPPNANGLVATHEDLYRRSCNARTFEQLSLQTMAFITVIAPTVTSWAKTLSAAYSLGVGRSFANESQRRLFILHVILHAA